MFTAEITRANPGCFIFLLDQSGSMRDKMSNDGSSQCKADVVSDAINRLLQEIAVRCAKEEGIRDYFCVSVIGYGQEVKSAFTGSLSGKDTVPISEVAHNPARLDERVKKIPDGAGGLVEQKIRFPVWVEPIGEGGTPMCQAIEFARSIANRWIDQHPVSFPPVVLNLTDGESTDGNPQDAAERLKGLTNVDGNVLLFNLHVSSDRSSPITFPDSEVRLPNDYARKLFRMSSQLPTGMRIYAEQQGFGVSRDTRGFVFNADATSIVQFLDIGTRATRHLLR